MYVNVIAALFFLPAAFVLAQDAAVAPPAPVPAPVPDPAPPGELVTKTQTLTTTFTHTVTVSLIATASIQPPQVNNTIPKSGYLSPTESGYGPIATDVGSGDNYNLPASPPKSQPTPSETATITPAGAASSIVGNKILIGSAGLLAILATW